METIITATHDGTIDKVVVNSGETLEKGQLIIKMK